MSEPKYTGILAELDTFQRELCLYRFIMNHQIVGKELSDDEMRAVSVLKPKLVRKVGRLRTLLTELVGTMEDTIYVCEVPHSVDIWRTGLKEQYDYRSQQTLNTCIDVVGEAIGKLEDGI